ncbi:O-antigen ligase family protein [Rhodococcus sp. NPDC060090]|uniref:O-antigen ligase family protein n=1 Tax=Rhodococcus sp. NPDC060090 TaxID=3347056 RepID=UPI003667A9D9
MNPRSQCAGFTLIWICIAAVLPVYRVLPVSLKLAWFVAVLGLISISLVLGRVSRPMFPAVWLFAGFSALIATVTATDNAVVSENLYVGAQLFLLIGVGPFAMRWMVERNVRFTRNVGAAFLVGQTLSSSAGILQVTGVTILGSTVTQGRAPGLAAHPNTLGVLALVAILICVYELTQHRRRKVIFSVTVILILNIGGLLATGSLSSLLAGAFGILVLAVCIRDRVSNVLRIGIFIGLLSWLILSLTSFSESLRTPADRFMQVTGQTSAESTWGIRLRTYEFAWSSISREPLFGVGLSPERGVTFDGITVAHNIFLRAWFQGGLLLAISVALIIGAIAIVALRSMWIGESGLAAGLLVAMMGFALTSAFFEQPDYWLPVLLAWASLGHISREPQQANVSPVEAGVTT